MSPQSLERSTSTVTGHKKCDKQHHKKCRQGKAAGVQCHPLRVQVRKTKQSERNIPKIQIRIIVAPLHYQQEKDEQQKKQKTN